MKAPRWVVAPVSSGLVLVLLLGAIGAGLRIPGLSYLSGLPGLGLLDYRTLSGGGFLPLRAGYVDGLLGTSLAAQQAPGRPGPAAGPGAASAPLDPVSLFLPRPEIGDDAAAPFAVADHPFTNDSMSSPITATSLPFVARTDNRAATREPGEPESCPGSGGTAWYRYTAKRDGVLSADTIGSDHATSIGVFTGSGAALRQAACGSSATGSAALSFPATTGQTYLFQVAALVRGGRLVFSLSALGRTTLASLPAPQRGASDSGLVSAVSGDGRYVAYENGTLPFCREENCPRQLLVMDRRTGRTTLVSRSLTGGPGNGPSVEPSLSDDGRYVGFSSKAADLVTDDTNGAWDYFVHDRLTGRTVRASVATGGRQGTKAEFVTRRASGRISPDGRFATFSSTLGDLVEDDPPGPSGGSNGSDVFVHDLQTGRTTMESVDPAGRRGDRPSTFSRISAGGRYVAFLSEAGSLAGGPFPPCAGAGDERYAFSQTETCLNVFLRDRWRGTTQLISVGRDGRADRQARDVDLSADGRVIAWSTQSALGDPADTNGVRDVFLVDRSRPAPPRRVSLSSTGRQQEVTEGPATHAQTGFYAMSTDVSGDGTRVAFASASSNLVPGDDNSVNDIFLRDLATGTTTRVSTDSGGRAANGDSYRSSLSHDGRVVVFDAEATNLTPEDNNGVNDVFVHDLSGV